MDGSYNNDHRVHNHLDTLDNSNTVNAIYAQINQFNSHFTDYQIRNNKKIESINRKVDFQFNAINEKLKGISRQVNDIGRTITLYTTDGIQRSDEKVLEIFNKHINKLSNDIQELSSSLYTGNNNSRGQLSSGKNIVSVDNGHVQNRDGGQRNNSHETSPEVMAVDMDIDNRNRSWPKSLSLRSPAPQPNSAPSSPIANRYFDFGSTLERNSMIRNDINYANESGINTIENHTEVGLENVQRMDTDTKGCKYKKSKSNVQEIGLGNSQQYIYSSVSSRPNGFQGTKEFLSNAKRLSPNNNMENLTPGLMDGQNAKLSEYNDFDNLNEINVPNRASIMSNQSRTLEIGPEIEVVPNSFGQAPKATSEKRDVITLSPVKKRLSLKTKGDSTKQAKNNIPGVSLLKGRKPSTTPQYKLEKSLRNVFEIWKEYEYGINGKPPLKQLEAQYSTKWRNETELRTFLRRKKIYDAIERGKKAGYTERQVIDELELLRTYDMHGNMKKKPLLWLYSNIPRKFS
ncbi:uncharacterized protein AC631_01722 [Debaryomyces fabryi]|uniref:Transcription activator GCR1-like domain-containing protein n=1 Tax=Debaryomyces fabryi TaxID=58627 RepID=A0A0V1Q253_9ASCO|nr:uncharacterized protein AC631_01722 [Debaryomyces fabryi]KSA02547.1 hypothetical protein AC631_01722 [Debaryomyces fabryi]CUM47695.1 unnamed protein product [Debaryomyces fabryi]